MVLSITDKPLVLAFAFSYILELASLISKKVSAVILFEITMNLYAAWEELTFLYRAAYPRICYILPFICVFLISLHNIS